MQAMTGHGMQEVGSFFPGEGLFFPEHHRDLFGVWPEVGQMYLPS
jgi:hypothetical protein